MSNDCLGDCCAACCGVCCIGCTEAISNWSLFASCGTSGGSGGCCGSCCKRSFDDDDFAREEAKINQRRGAAQGGSQDQVRGGSQTVSEQPTPRQSMEMRQNASEGAGVVQPEPAAALEAER